MRIEHESVVNAPVDAVWRVFSDVERWPEMAESFRRVAYVTGDHLEVGARLRIEQPRLPAAVWEVTEVEPGRSWTWASGVPGFRSVASHTVEALDGNRTRVAQAITQTGPLGEVFGRLYARLSRRYVQMEAEGLARLAEARSA